MPPKRKTTDKPEEAEAKRAAKDTGDLASSEEPQLNVEGAGEQVAAGVDNGDAARRDRTKDKADLEKEDVGKSETPVEQRLGEQRQGQEQQLQQQQESAGDRAKADDSLKQDVGKSEGQLSDKDKDKDKERSDTSRLATDVSAGVQDSGRLQKDQGLEQREQGLSKEAQGAAGQDRSYKEALVSDTDANKAGQQTAQT